MGSRWQQTLSILIMATLGHFHGALALSPKSLHSESAIIIDARTGITLFEKNADTQHHPASITKILTGLLAIEHGLWEDMLTVSRPAAHGITPGSSSIALKPGEQVTMKDVIYALMLRSANECGNVIAEVIAGGNAAFSNLMNEKAGSLGCTASHFVNPHGLHHDDHLVTARDMARITLHAMSLPRFREVVQTPFYPFPDTNIHTHRERGNLRNKNELLHTRSREHFPGATGVKGGYTRKSLHTFVASAQKDGHEVIVVVLKAPTKPLMYADLLELLPFGLNQFTERVLVDSRFEIQTIEIHGGHTHLSVQTREAVRITAPVAMNLQEVERRILPVWPSLPIRENDPLGTLEFLYQGQLLGKTALVAGNDVLARASWEYLKRYVISLPFLLGTAILIGAAILMIPVRSSKARSPHSFR